MTKIVLLAINNILIQLSNKLAKIKVNNYYLVNASKINITIYIVRLIKDFRLKFLKQTQSFTICIVYKVE